MLPQPHGALTRAPISDPDDAAPTAVLDRRVEQRGLRAPTLSIAAKARHVLWWTPVCPLVASAVALAVGSPASGSPLPPTEPAPQFLWVAYKYPSLSKPRNEWDSAIKTGAGQSFVVNIANGPGKLANADYRQVVSHARAAGIGLSGYVYTSYGARPVAAVRADIDRWPSTESRRSSSTRPLRRRAPAPKTTAG